MFLRLRRGLPILVPHGGLVTVSYGHVDDLCAQLIAMADAPRAVAGEVVNATGQSITSAGYVQLLAQIAGADADVRMVPDEVLATLREKFDRPLWSHLFNERHHGILSTDKAARLGLPMERGFLTGHQETYEWFGSSPLADAPDELFDPVWKAGYDFAAESAAVTVL